MDEYNDKEGAPIEEGLYIYEISEKTYFRIQNIPQKGWVVTSSLNPKLFDSLTPDLASKLTPLRAPKMEIGSLRGDANWLEEQLKYISAPRHL